VPHSISITIKAKGVQGKMIRKLTGILLLVWVPLMIVAQDAGTGLADPGIVSQEGNIA
jgi:hypothetical protein